MSTRSKTQSDARTRLLDAAMQAIRAQGYSATSVDDICREAGLTKGAFFHHFKSKEDLALAAAAHFSEMAERLFAAAPFFRGGAERLLPPPPSRRLAPPLNPLRGCVDSPGPTQTVPTPVSPRP